MYIVTVISLLVQGPVLYRALVLYVVWFSNGGEGNVYSNCYKFISAGSSALQSSSSICGVV